MEVVIKIMMIVCLALIVIGLLMLWWCDYSLKKIAENLRRLDIEGEYRTKSHEIIFRWRLLRLYHGCDDSYVENWYYENTLTIPGSQINNFDENTFGAWMNEVKDKTGRKGKELFHPIRMALTGEANGPELKTLLPLIGYDKAYKRLRGEKA